MPLKLNVGVSRKIGLPEYSSIGATCNLELEADPMLIHGDLDGLHEQIRGAFVAARQAVNDELARLQAQAAPAVVGPPPPAGGDGHAGGAAGPARGPTAQPDGPARSNGAAASPGGGRGRPARPATANRVRAIVTIARRQHADLEGLLRDGYGVDRPEDLTLAQASAFIDQLKAAGAL